MDIEQTPIDMKFLTHSNQLLKSWRIQVGNNLQRDYSHNLKKTHFRMIEPVEGKYEIDRVQKIF